MTSMVLSLWHDLLPRFVILVQAFILIHSPSFNSNLALLPIIPSLSTTVPLYARGEGRRKSLKVKELLASRLDSRGFAKEIVNS